MTGEVTDRLQPSLFDVKTSALTGRLLEIVSELEEAEGNAVMQHLAGDTSAEWLSSVLTDAGYPVSATTIRTQRRAWRREAA